MGRRPFLLLALRSARLNPELDGCPNYFFHCMFLRFFDQTSTTGHRFWMGWRGCAKRYKLPPYLGLGTSAVTQITAFCAGEGANGSSVIFRRRPFGHPRGPERETLCVIKRESLPCRRSSSFGYKAVPFPPLNETYMFRMIIFWRRGRSNMSLQTKFWTPHCLIWQGPRPKVQREKNKRN